MLTVLRAQPRPLVPVSHGTDQSEKPAVAVDENLLDAPGPTGETAASHGCSRANRWRRDLDGRPSPEESHEPAGVVTAVATETVQYEDSPSYFNYGRYRLPVARNWSPSDTYSRRGFITGTAAAAVGLASPTVAVGAASDGDGRGAEDVGILTAVETLLEEHNHEQAKRLLDKHDVEYSYNRVAMPRVSNGASDAGEGVSTQAEYDESPSWFSQFAFHNYDNVYRSHADWGLEFDSGSDDDVDSAGPKDGVGLTVNGDYWEPVLDSWEFGEGTSLRKRDRYGRGIIGEFDDPESSAPSWERQSWQHLDFRKTESGEHNIYGTYVHSWNKFSAPGGITYGFGVGPITVGTSTSTGYWKQRSDVTE